MKTYAIIDKVRNETEAYINAVNDRDCIRTMVYSGYFQINRLKDTEVKEVKMIKTMGRSIDIKKVLKSLELEPMEKAKDIKGKTTEEVKKEIEKEVKENEDVGGEKSAD